MSTNTISRPPAFPFTLQEGQSSQSLDAAEEVAELLMAVRMWRERLLRLHAEVPEIGETSHLLSVVELSAQNILEALLDQKSQDASES